MAESPELVSQLAVVPDMVSDVANQQLSSLQRDTINGINRIIKHDMALGDQAVVTAARLRSAYDVVTQTVMTDVQIERLMLGTTDVFQDAGWLVDCDDTTVPTLLFAYPDMD